MLSDYNNIITPNQNDFNFLDYKDVPRYLKKTNNSNIDFKYTKGSLLVPDIAERLDTFLEVNNLIEDKEFILKKLRKIIGEVTSDERKKSKQISIRNARQKQCEKYNQDINNNNFVVNDQYDYQLNDNQLPTYNFNYNITPRKSARIRKKTTKYNPYTGQAQIVGTGRKFIYLRK